MDLPIFAALTASPRRASSLRSARRIFTGITRAVRSTIAPTTLFTTPAVQPAAQPDAESVEAALFTDEDMPPVQDIEAAAATYFRAADAARTADRQKRASRKLLDKLPAGRFGAWLIERESSGRQTADLDEIKRIFKANGLGGVPMKSSAPTLKVKRVQVDVPAALVEAELSALAGVR